MANKQINELNELTTASGTDLLLVYDLNEAGSEKTKKITVSNLVTSYEEGTWTPVPADAVSGGNTGSAATALGSYTKVGRQITISCRLLGINTGGLTTNNQFFVQGLPYVAQTTVEVNYYGPVFYAYVSGFADLSTAWIRRDTASVTFAEITSGGAGSVLLVEDLTSGSAEILFTITYEI
jgi:hypothetical protein